MVLIVLHFSYIPLFKDWHRASVNNRLWMWLECLALSGKRCLNLKSSHTLRSMRSWRWVLAATSWMDSLMILISREMVATSLTPLVMMNWIWRCPNFQDEHDRVMEKWTAKMTREGKMSGILAAQARVAQLKGKWGQKWGVPGGKTNLSTLKFIKWSNNNHDCE